MLKVAFQLVLGFCLISLTVCAQDDTFFEGSTTPRLDSLRNLLPHRKDTITANDLNIALEIRKSSRRYTMDHRVYTYIIRGALNADQPEVAERYARELFPVFQMLHLSRYRMNRGIECRNLCFILSDYYYEKGDIRRGNYFQKLTLTRFHARFCGTGKWGQDYRLMLQLIEQQKAAGQLLKAKHWQRKAKRFHRRHLV